MSAHHLCSILKKTAILGAKAVGSRTADSMRNHARIKIAVALGLTSISLQASFFSFAMFHLDAPTSSGFQTYVDQFESTAITDFTAAGKLAIEDNRSQESAAAPVIEPRLDRELPNGNIQHVSGLIHINGVPLDAVRKLIEDYPNYVTYFKGDLNAASGTLEADSTDNDEHFRSRFRIESHSPWISISLDSLYDSHNRLLDHGRWISRSASVSIREMRDIKNPMVGMLPEGNDHGFLWRSNLYWLARERKGGVDLELDSIVLSRHMPGLFATWCKKRNRQGVENMLTDVKVAMASRS
jgi:hypothetical protein